MNKSRHTYKQIMSHVRESHVTHTNESCHTDTSGANLRGHSRGHFTTVTRVMTHTEMSHVTRMNKSCCTSIEANVARLSRGIVETIPYCHVTITNESCCISTEANVARLWRGIVETISYCHVTITNESCCTSTEANVARLWRGIRSFSIVMSHVWMSHVTRMNESCHTFTETKVARLLRGIVEAIYYCHCRGVSHRDLKLCVRFCCVSRSSFHIILGEFSIILRGISHWWLTPRRQPPRP